LHCYGTTIRMEHIQKGDSLIIDEKWIIIKVFAEMGFSAIQLFILGTASSSCNMKEKLNELFESIALILVMLKINAPSPHTLDYPVQEY
jgi:hypothetical protein